MAGDSETGVTIFELEAGLDTGRVALGSEPSRSPARRRLRHARAAAGGARRRAAGRDLRPAGGRHARADAAARAGRHLRGEDRSRRATARSRAPGGRAGQRRARAARRTSAPTSSWRAATGSARCAVAVADVAGAAGRLLADDDRLLLGTSDGTLELLEVKPAGKQRDDRRRLPARPAASLRRWPAERDGRSPPSRRCAFAVVRRVFEQDAYADRAFRAEADRLALERPRPRLRDAARLRHGAAQADARLPDRALRRSAIPPSSTRRCWPRCASASTRSPIWSACPTTPPSARASSWSRADAAAATGFVNAILRRATREAASCWSALDDATPAERRAAALAPASGSPSCGGRRSAPSEARALMRARQRAGRERGARQHAARRRATRCSQRWPSWRSMRSTPRAARGDRARRRRSTCTAPTLYERGRADAAVARVDAGRARVSIPQPGERVLDLCAAPGRQDDAPRGADGRTRARSWRSSATPGRARGDRATTARGWARPASRCEVGDAAEPSLRRRLRPRAGRSALLRPRHAAVAPRRALAQEPRADRRAGASCRRRMLDAGAGRAAPGRHARLLDLHDQRRRERTAGRGVRSAGPTSSRSTWRERYPQLRASRQPVVSCKLCPSATERTASSSRPFASDSSDMSKESKQPDPSSEPFDLGTECPNCREPWLRPTQLPGRYRCVYCLHALPADVLLPELRRALDDRAHERHREPDLRALRRLDAEARMSRRRR